MLAVRAGDTSSLAPLVERHHRHRLDDANRANSITLFPRLRGENSYLGQEQKISGFSGIQPVQNLEVVPTFTAL